MFRVGNGGGDDYVEVYPLIVRQIRQELLL
jgi:hypothetical protein